MVKTSDFVLIFQIASDWLELEVCKYQRGRNLRCQQESSGRIKCFVQQISISDDGKDFSHFVVLISEEVLSRSLQVAGFSKMRIHRVKKNLSVIVNNQTPAFQI